MRFMIATDLSVDFVFGKEFPAASVNAFPGFVYIWDVGNVPS
ncbi:MAG: hypothetical protein ACLFWB_12750 [Armatimonadota bacterium]